MKPQRLTLQAGVWYASAHGLVALIGHDGRCTNIAWPGDVVRSSTWAAGVGMFGAELRQPDHISLATWTQTYDGAAWFAAMRQASIDERMSLLLARLARYPAFGLSGRGVRHLRIPRRWLGFLAGCSREAATYAIQSLATRGQIDAQRARIELIVPIT